MTLYKAVNIYWLQLIFIFISVFSYSSYLSSIGLDITDTGYLLSRQKLFFDPNYKFPYALVWVSDLIGGLWLWMSSPWGVWGASVGWCFLMTAFAMVCFSFLKKEFITQESFVITLFASCALIGGRIEVLYYTNLGAFFLQISGLLFYYYYYNENRKIFLVFCGLFVALAINSRFPNILCVIVFPIIFIVSRALREKRVSYSEIRGSLKLLLSITIWLGVFLIGLVLLGIWEGFFYNFKMTFGLLPGVEVQKEHGLFHLLNILVMHFYWKIEWSVLYLIGTFILMYGLCKLNKRALTLPWLLLFTFYFSILTWTFVNNLNAVRVALGAYVIMLSIFQISYSFFFIENGNDLREKVFFLNSLFLSISLMSIAGSNVGFLNLHVGLWVLLPLQILFLKDLFKIKDQVFTYGLIVLMAPIAFVTVLNVLSTPYRDLGDSEALNTRVSDYPYDDIKTSESRAKAISELMTEAKKLIPRGDIVLAYNNIPFLYYVTDTYPYFESLWPILQGKAGVDRFIKLAKKTPKPKFIVRAMTNTESYTWGNGATIPPHNKLHFQGLQEIDKWVSNQGYRLVWRNSDFAIFELIGS